MMHHGCDGIFVGSGIFGAENPEAMGEAIVAAVNNYDDPETLKEIAKSPGKGMSGQANALLDEDEKLQGRGV
jgi:pyridoxal 5'-phosphate synthase pdxS subunit